VGALIAWMVFRKKGVYKNNVSDQPILVSQKSEPLPTPIKSKKPTAKRNSKKKNTKKRKAKK